MIMLRCVQSKMQAGDESPVNLLRNLLEEAIDSLKPAGERKMMSPEWTLYNNSAVEVFRKPQSPRSCAAHEHERGRSVSKAADRHSRCH